jgi:anti-anti-sigma regulatory factor
MRHHVPFVGERKVVRADDDLARSKRASGRIIDDVVGDGVAPSSWEDVVPTASSGKSKQLFPEQPARASLPVKPGGKTPSVSPNKPAPAKKPVTSSGSLTFSDSASMDWVRINQGRGLRVTVYGNMDNDLRREWSRLLNDPDSADVKEFEFNLTETPALSLTGLGMLLLFKERKGFGREAITLCNCNKGVAELLQWTGMDKYFVIQDQQTSAIK